VAVGALALVAAVLVPALFLAPGGAAKGDGVAPTDLALAGGQVWMSSVAIARSADGQGLRPVHQVERFDPTTLARTAGPLRLEAAWGLETGRRRLWVVGRGRLEVIDPASARVAARVRGLHWAVADLAIDARSAWAIESQVSRLRRIDVARGRPAGPWRRPSPRAMLAVALGEGALWVTEIGPRLPRPGVSPTPRGRGALDRLDPVTGRIEGRLRVGRGPAAVAVGFGSVWVMNGVDGTLTRIDPSRMTTLSTIRLAEPGGPGAPTVDLAIGPDRVWVANPSWGAQAFAPWIRRPTGSSSILRSRPGAALRCPSPRARKVSS
jgi:hypothetical protein